MKRYAIVRVDNKCLSDYENIKCPYDYKCAKCKFGKLKNYNYGDTKEQLVMKVAQVIKRELKGDCVAGLKDTVFVMEWCVVEKLAKEIVEFLGVEK